MEHGARKHARYGGSGAARWMACPASVKLASTVPYVPPPQWAMEGTCAHELLDYCLSNKCFDAELALAMYGYNAALLDDNQDVQKEQVFQIVDSVQTVLDYVLALLETYEDAVLLVEHPFQIPSVDPNNTWGTNDILIHVPSLSLVYVIDFKHGAGVAVEVTDTFGHPNKQLMFYGTGAYCGGIEAETWVLVIAQPRIVHRNGPIRTHTVASSALRDFRDTINTAIIAAQQPDAPYAPNNNNCKWCPAAAVCPAREARALAVVNQQFRTVRDVGKSALPNPKELSIERIGQILSMQKALEDWLDEVRSFAYGYAMSGGTIFNYKLVEPYGRRQWPESSEAQQHVASDLLQMMGGDWDSVFPRRLIPITEAETRLRTHFKANAPKGGKKEASEEAGKIMAAFTTKEKSSKLQLVPITDTRPAVNRAGQAFTNVQVLPPLPNLQG